MCVDSCFAWYRGVGVEFSHGHQTRKVDQSPAGTGGVYTTTRATLATMVGDRRGRRLRGLRQAKQHADHSLKQDCVKGVGTGNFLHMIRRKKGKAIWSAVWWRRMLQRIGPLCFTVCVSSTYIDQYRRGERGRQRVASRGVLRAARLHLGRTWPAGAIPTISKVGALYHGAAGQRVLAVYSRSREQRMPSAKPKAEMRSECRALVMWGRL